MRAGRGAGGGSPAARETASVGTQIGMGSQEIQQHRRRGQEIGLGQIGSLVGLGLLGRFLALSVEPHHPPGHKSARFGI